MFELEHREGKSPEVGELFALSMCRAGRAGCIFVIVLFMCANCKQLA